MSQISIDADRFPLVFVRYPQTITIGDVDDFIEALKKVYDRGRLVVVIDLSRVKSSAVLRAYVAKKIDEVTLAYPNRVMAEAVVTPSALIRGAVTAYNWLKKDKSYPTRTFKEKVQAFDWAMRRLREAGIGRE